MNRRDFMRQSLIGTGMLAAMSTAQSTAANEIIVVGVMGLGGRGTFLAESFSKRPDVQIAYLCDADTRQHDAASLAAGWSGSTRSCVVGFRLEDRDGYQHAGGQPVPQTLLPKAVGDP